MVRVALVGRDFEGQMKNEPRLAEMEIVWVGSSLSELQRVAAGLEVDALVVGLDDLGGEPTSQLDTLMQQLGPQVVIITYDFARKDLIRSLQRNDTRVLPAPVTLSVLRSQLTGLIVRNIFANRAKAQPTASVGSTCPTCGSELGARQAAAGA